MPRLTIEEIDALPVGVHTNRLVIENILGWYVSPGGLVDRNHKPGDVFFGDVCEEFNPSESLDAAYYLEDHILNKLSIAVDYINQLKRIILKDNNSVVDGDWVCLFYIAHATPLQKCKAALIARLGSVWIA